MSESLAELRTLPDDEIIRRHDAASEHTVVGTKHYLDELARRDQDRQTATMVRLTWVITGLTVVNVLIFLWQVLAGR